MATSYFQDPFGAADYSAEGTRGLLEFLRDEYPRIYGAGAGLLQNTPYDTADAYSVFDPKRQAAFEAAQAAFPVGLALDVVPGVRALKQPAMQLGRAGERLAERVVPQIMERGGMGAGLDALRLVRALAAVHVFAAVARLHRRGQCAHVPPDGPLDAYARAAPGHGAVCRQRGILVVL